MDSFFIIIIIGIILFASVAGIAVVQKKEQAKALIRQKIAKYKYRANEATNILDNFSSIPIGADARSLLLFYIKLNLSAARQLSPNDRQLVNNIKSINTQLENPQSKVDNKKLNIPKDFQKLNTLIKHLSKLGQYLIKFKTIKAMPAARVSPAIGRITLLISEAKICAYIQQGKKSLAEHNYVNGQRNFQTAQQMLDKYQKKDERLLTLEKELKELVKLKPSEAAKKQLSIDSEQQEHSKESDDNIFGPKKKW